jgi:hypothetical protein
MFPPKINFNQYLRLYCRLLCIALYNNLKENTG